MALGLACLRQMPVHAQQPDSALQTYALPALTVSATRSTLPLAKVPLSIQSIDRHQISRARPTWGLDEALASVPGVYAANRYNFSLDQRLSIRGFGSRSAFAVRGIKVLLDGIPQSLPDGQGQLTNLELGAVDRIEVLRGSASALFGNASGGVISIWTDPTVPQRLTQEIRVVAGTFDRALERTWTKWQSSSRLRVGNGSALVTVSRLAYEGERDHSEADLRNLNTRFQLPLSAGWSLAVLADVGDQPRADNPGSLGLAELQSSRNSVPMINLTRRAGKDVMQAQAGATLRRQFAAGGEAAATLFWLTRDLKNPTTFAYIDLDRQAYGARLSVTRPLPLGSLAHRLTAGFDFQRQRDDRRNSGNNAGQPDTARLLDQLERVTELGPFVQSALEITPQVTLTAGLRYDRVKFQAEDRLVTASNPDDSGERLMDAVSGSLGVAVTPSDASTLYASVGTSFETPTTTELTNRPTGAGGFNPELEPQKATTYEIGVRGDVNRRGSWSLALFQADVRGSLISFEVPDTTFTGRRFFRNAGSARHRGVELGVDIALVPGLDVAATWTFSDFTYKVYRLVTPAKTYQLDGRELPGVPRHWLHLTLRARPAFAPTAWAEVEETHSSDYPVDDTMSVRTSGWWTTNVRLGWDGTVGGLRLSPFVGFNNVFNRHYIGSVVINAAPIRIGTELVPGRYYEPAPGRNMYVGLSLGAGR